MERPLSLSFGASANPKKDPKSARKQHLLEQAWRRYRTARMAEARQFCLQTLSLDARDSGALHLLGLIEYQSGNYEIAVRMIRRALAVNANEAVYHVDLGNALVALRNYEEATACYKTALVLDPNASAARNNLCGALHYEGKLEEAIDCYERTLALNPELPETHNNLALALHAIGRLGDAAEHCETALRLSPDFPDAHNTLGMAFHSQGRLAEAVSCFERAVTIKPGFAEAHQNLSISRLIQGDFAAGWSKVEWRWKTSRIKSPMRLYAQPLWRGENLAPGRILLWGEQGVGDEVMFAGLFRDAVRTGNVFLVDCDSRLRTLLARSFPEVQVVVGLDSGHAAEAAFVAHLPSGSLPAIFRKSESAFAATQVPYLIPDPTLRSEYRGRYGDGRPLVGIAWHTKNQETGRIRSIDLSLLAPLLSRPEFRFVCLQYGDFESLEKQAMQANVNLLIDRSVNQLVDMDRFAAQAAAMDLVITIDNSTAHLAGALGIPVWVLLPHIPDWRWLLDRIDSPWYPTIRLFRQPAPGDWKSVLARVEEQLGLLAISA